MFFMLSFEVCLFIKCSKYLWIITLPVFTLIHCNIARTQKSTVSIKPELRCAIHTKRYLILALFFFVCLFDCLLTFVVVAMFCYTKYWQLWKLNNSESLLVSTNWSNKHSRPDPRPDQVNRTLFAFYGF